MEESCENVDLQVVFIHTRTFPPLHLILNYSRTKSILEQTDVWMLHDTKFRFWNLFQKQITFQRTQEEEELDASYKYPKSFRNNFWFSSLVRFSLLARFMSSHDAPTIHVESDVILAADFPIGEFLKITTPFAYPIVSDERGIASTIFIRDKKSAEFLWQYSRRVVQQNPLASDMEILFDLWTKHPNLVTKLPIAPHHLYKAPRDQEKSSFTGYFDGHDFGVYIGGTNPWNKRGVSKIKSSIEGSHLAFDHNLILYDKNRKFISIRRPNRFDLDSLYSLHVTNKNPIFFTRRLLPPVLRIWLLLYVRINKTFHPIVFVIMIVKSIKRRLFNLAR